MNVSYIDCEQFYQERRENIVRRDKIKFVLIGMEWNS